MIDVARWMEEGGRSTFLKGTIGKHNTKDSVCWFFTVILVFQKKSHGTCAEVVTSYIGERCFEEEHCKVQMGCHRGKLTVSGFFIIRKL